MSHNSTGKHNCRSKALGHRTLRLEPLEPRRLLAANFLGLIDPAMAAYAKSLYADGSISRSDTIAILRTIQRETDGVVDATDLKDLRTIVRNASTLKMANSVSVLANDVVNGSRANAYYQGASLGNLAVGSSNAKLGKLTDKWFYGADLPSTGGYAYATASGSLYSPAGPSHFDEKQGNLGDCYLIAGLGSIADSSQTAVKNMFIGNGDGTWTVRFYYNGKADYVTVDRKLPVSGSYLIFDGYGSKYSNTANTLWLPLLEKAYAQWNETGRTGQGTYSNSYKGIEGGWMGDVYQQALGSSTIYATDTSASSARTTLINALASHRATTLGTVYNPNFNSTGLYGGHAYNVLSYNAYTGRFTLYNPWGSNQPKQLTWTQLSTNAGWYSSTVTTRSTAARSAVSGSFFTSFAALPADTVTTTASTLDMPAAVSPADASSVAAAVDAVFTERGALTANTSRQTATTLPSSDSWLSDSAAHTGARSSADVFADIDALLDSMPKAPLLENL